jgi:hypothetical protein
MSPERGVRGGIDMGVIAVRTDTRCAAIDARCRLCPTCFRSDSEHPIRETTTARMPAGIRYLI